jgi:outer membrane immunogenic protein
MKILATVIVLTLCLFVGSSYAADRYDWSGIYGGASIGYVHASQDWTLGRSQFWGAKGDNQDFTFNQFDIGGYVGAQYQWKWLVLGAEGGIFKGPHDEQSEHSPRYPSTDQWRADIHTIAKATAKVGYAYDRFLFYAKGGYAGAMVDTDARYNINAVPLIYNPKTSEWQSGWTVGGGVEYALTKHWIIGAEYSYIDLGTQAHKTISNGTLFDAKVDAAVHQVLFRVSFKF